MIGRTEIPRWIGQEFNVWKKELELAKELPAKRSLMIGRTEIPKWIGQEFDVWKKGLEIWNENDNLTDETKYCNVMESL